MKYISQREARALRKRVAELEAREQSRFLCWGAEYVEGTNVASQVLDADSKLITVIKTARRLRHAVVVTADNERLYYYALPAPERKA